MGHMGQFNLAYLRTGAKGAGRTIITVQLISAIIAVIMTIADQGPVHTLGVATPELLLGIGTGGSQSTRGWSLIRAVRAVIDPVTDS